MCRDIDILVARNLDLIQHPAGLRLALHVGLVTRWSQRSPSRRSRTLGMSPSTLTMPHMVPIETKVMQEPMKSCSQAQVAMSGMLLAD